MTSDDIEVEYTCIHLEEEQCTKHMTQAFMLSF